MFFFSGERILKSEISNLQVEKSVLETKISNLVSTRAGEKATLSTLEKKLADERKQKADYQLKLESERKSKKEQVGVNHCRECRGSTTTAELFVVSYITYIKSRCWKPTIFFQKSL